jgi:hypothetical protein
MIARGAAGVVTREPNGNSFATLEREPSVYRYRSERDYHDLYRERGLVGVASSFAGTHGGVRRRVSRIWLA